MTDRENRLGYLFVVLAAVCWASGASASKFLFCRRDQPRSSSCSCASRPPARCCWSGCSWRRPRLLRIEPRDIPYFLLLGTLGMAAINITYLYAISRLNVAAALILEYLAPALIAAYTVVVRRERLSLWTALSIAAAVAGCYLVVGAYSLDLLQLNLPGILSGLGAAVAFAWWSVHGEYGMHRYDPWTVLFYALLVAAVEWNLLHPPLEAFLHRYDPATWGWILFVAVVGAILPFGLYYEGINRIRATRASITSTVEPIVAGHPLVRLPGRGHGAAADRGGRHGDRRHHPAAGQTGARRKHAGPHSRTGLRRRDDARPDRGRPMIAATEKRLKRQVVGRRHAFFAVTAPGVEDLARSELAALGLEGHTVPGGVEFTGRLHDAYLANLHLRTAGRVLMRIAAFTTTHFSELEQQAAGIPWELYLRPGTLGRVQVAVHHCRLHHTDGIAERVRAGVDKRLAPIPAGEAAPAAVQQVFVRGVDDRFTVSLDSSGDHLHLRGVKTHPGRAPLRETLAAAALMRAGYTGDEPLLDPMCGTGTFALEAALMAKRIPAGWFRDFAFTGWPAFRAQRWAHLRRTAGEQVRVSAAAAHLRLRHRPRGLPRPGGMSAEARPGGCRAGADRGFLPARPRRPAAVGTRAGRPQPALRPAPGHPVRKPRHDAMPSSARLRDRFHGWRFVLVAPASVRPAGLPRARPSTRFSTAA